MVGSATVDTESIYAPAQDGWQPLVELRLERLDAAD